MTHTEDITFLSEEGIAIHFSQDHIQYVELLDMLYRNSHGQRPIKTGVCTKDLMLSAAMCEVGLYPCLHQTILNPEGFDTFQELCDYMGIDVEEDSENDYLNDFLSFLGLETEPGDDVVYEYEGWTDEMIAAQKEDDEREMRREMNRELAEMLSEEEREIWWD